MTKAKMFCWFHRRLTTYGIVPLPTCLPMQMGGELETLSNLGTDCSAKGLSLEDQKKRV